MKLVEYTDPDGYNHKSLIRDTDTDPTVGIMQSPPDLRRLDWESIARNIHNELLARGILTIKDVQIRQTEFNQVVLARVGKKIYQLYQQQENHEDD